MTHDPREIRRHYREYFDDPQWKMFREQFLFLFPNCFFCGQSAEDVHHTKYRNALPWEYDHSECRAVCRVCHKDIHLAASDVWNELISLSPTLIHVVLKLLREANESNNTQKCLINALRQVQRSAMSESEKALFLPWLRKRDT